MCLYPILNHPGWLDGRHCHNGLWDYADAHGHRDIYKPLARELRRWQKVFDGDFPHAMLATASSVEHSDPESSNSKSGLTPFEFQISEL